MAAARSRGASAEFAGTFRSRPGYSVRLVRCDIMRRLDTTPGTPRLPHPHVAARAAHAAGIDAALLARTYARIKRISRWPLAHSGTICVTHKGPMRGGCPAAVAQR